MCILYDLHELFILLIAVGSKNSTDSTEPRMYRAYIGNLDSQITEATLTELFEEHNLGLSNVVVKRGYAFVDCPDQNLLDKAIDELNGKRL